MRLLRGIFPWFALCIFVSAVTWSLAAQTDGAPLAYPKAKTVDQVDDYHGVEGGRSLSLA